VPVIARVHIRQRVAELDTVQGLALGGRHDAAFQAVALQAALHQLQREQQEAALGVDQRVVQLGVEVQRLVGGDGPRGRGPDDRERVLVQLRQAEGGGQLVGLRAGKGHVQRLALLVGVLDLELGQRRAAVEAPVHRLQAAVDEAALDHALERPQLARLVGEIHRAVRVRPVAQHAQALEVDHLLRDLLGGVGAALGLHVVTAQVAAVLLLDGVFDRQAVAVPAGDVQRVETGELARLGDHVLQDLVHRVAHVDRAVGVGRAVVQDELRRTAARFAQALVAAFVLPLLDPARLALGQVAPHRERGVGQVEGLAVVARGRVGGRSGFGGHVGTGFRPRPEGRRREGGGRSRRDGAVAWRRVALDSGDAPNSIARGLPPGADVTVRLSAGWLLGTHGARF